MSLQVGYTPTEFVAAGGETDVLIAYWFTSASQLFVYNDRALQILTTDYTVTLPTDEATPDGKITLVVPLSGGDTIRIFRFVPPTQVEAFLYGGKVASATIEALADAQMMRLQEEELGYFGVIPPNPLVRSAEILKASSQYLRKADNASLSTGNIDFTLSFWVSMGALTPDQGIAGKWVITTGNQREYLLHFRATPPRIVFRVSPDGVSDGTGVVTPAETPIGLNTWYHVVVWHDATANTVNIQLDNDTVVSTVHTGGAFDSTAPFEIGRLDEGSQHLTGLVAEVYFFKTVLTAAERTELQANVISSSLLAKAESHWPLTEASGFRNDTVGTNHLFNANDPGWQYRELSSESPNCALIDSSLDTVLQWESVQLEGVVGTIKRFGMTRNPGHMFTVVASGTGWIFASGTVGVPGEIILAGGVDFTSSVLRDAITFVCDGVNYYEVSRSINT